MFAMRYQSLRFFLSVILIAFVSVSCTREILLSGNEDNTESGIEGDILTVNITLDNMGGTSTKADLDDPLAQWENYIDPEKIRVLVFDDSDKFLFESRNRWVKQLDQSAGHSSWAVSIPLYSYGNDRNDNWDWEEIRKRITENDFKIAILANRPDKEWNFGIHEVDAAGTELDGYIVRQGWFGSGGPYWTRANSIASPEDLAGRQVMDIFSLHHCQRDLIYEGKNYYTSIRNKENKSLLNSFQNFYGCITDGAPETPFMGATSSWVDWGENDTNNRDSQGWNFRKPKLPDDTHPIPMYGVQRFSAVRGWKKGTTLDLMRDSNGIKDKAISLLRSVVRLELLVPRTSTTKHVLLFYSNIYARCEPMDVWTPTDELWSNSHDDCEWKILKERRMTVSEDPQVPSSATLADETNNIKKSREIYQERLSQLYGIWRTEQGWSFNNAGYAGDLDATFDLKYRNEDFVRIFNPCIQRNNVLYVDKCESYESGRPNFDPFYAHYVVYTGERNINDASNLGQLGNTGGGNPTILYWTLIDSQSKTVSNSSTQNPQSREYYETFSLPIVEYKNLASGNDYAAVTKTGFVFAPDSRFDFDQTIPSNGEEKEEKQPNYSNTQSNTCMGTYLKNVQNSSIDPSFWPLPLLRNHIYRLTLTGTKSADGIPFSVHLEEKHTRDINFK